MGIISNKSSASKQRFLVFEIRQIEAGSGNINGRNYSWEAGTKFFGLPLGAVKGAVWSYRIASGKEAMIESKIGDLNWGAVVDVTLKGKEIIDIEPLYDWFPDFESLNM